MFLMAANHDVEDYDRWKAVYDEIDQGSMGALFGRVNRNVDNSNNITVIHGFASAEAARAFMENPALVAAMESAGVSSPPRFEVFEELEAVTY